MTLRLKNITLLTNKRETHRVRGGETEAQIASRTDI